MPIKTFKTGSPELAPHTPSPTKDASRDAVAEENVVTEAPEAPEAAAPAPAALGHRHFAAAAAAAVALVLWFYKPAPESFHSFCSSKRLMGGSVFDSLMGGNKWLCSNSGILRNLKVVNPSWRYHDLVFFSVVELAAKQNSYFVGTLNTWLAVPTLLSPVMDLCLDVLRVHMYILLIAVAYQLWTAVMSRFTAFLKGITGLITNAFYFAVFTALVYYNSQASAYVATAVCAAWTYAYKYQHLKPAFDRAAAVQSTCATQVKAAGSTALAQAVAGGSQVAYTLAGKVKEQAESIKATGMVGQFRIA